MQIPYLVLPNPSRSCLRTLHVPFLQIISSVSLLTLKAAIAIPTAPIATVATTLEEPVVPTVSPLQGQPHSTLLRHLQPRLCLQRWLKH